MKNVKMMLSALALAPVMMSCAAEPGDDGASDDAIDDAADRDEAAIAADEVAAESAALVVSPICPVLPTPPSPIDKLWYLSDTNTVEAVFVDPENEACDGYVINARFVKDFTVYLTDPASTPDKCTGTSLTVRRYLKSSSGIWASSGTSTVTGVWTIDGCRLPKVEWAADTTSDARIHITSRRAYGTSQYSVLLYGLPFVARATKYVYPSPN